MPYFAQNVLPSFYHQDFKYLMICFLSGTFISPLKENVALLYVPPHTMEWLDGEIVAPGAYLLFYIKTSVRGMIMVFSQKLCLRDRFFLLPGPARLICGSWHSRGYKKDSVGSSPTILKKPTCRNLVCFEILLILSQLQRFPRFLCE